ncbi:MAG TPA: DUF6491 family protein [Steroidobacteraceae bacterium]|nr:DUF6491 family protein [Steroidobacteraceae bacterium]
MTHLIRLRGGLWAALLLAGLLASATAAADSAAASGSNKVTVDLVMQYAGAPVDRFTYLGRYQGLKILSDTQVLLWTTINDAYLLTVRKPCVGLLFANGVFITSNSRSVTANLDRLNFENQSCFISEIRPVDYLKMKQEKKVIP